MAVFHLPLLHSLLWTGYRKGGTAFFPCDFFKQQEVQKTSQLGSINTWFVMAKVMDVKQIFEEPAFKSSPSASPKNIIRADPGLSNTDVVWITLYLHGEKIQCRSNKYSSSYWGKVILALFFDVPTESFLWFRKKFSRNVQTPLQVAIKKPSSIF